MSGNGIHCLEIRSVDEKPIVEHTSAEVKEIKNQLDAAGFRISSIGSPIGKIGIRDSFPQFPAAGTVKVGIGAQTPSGNGGSRRFENFEIRSVTAKDIRKGI